MSLFSYSSGIISSVSMSSYASSSICFKSANMLLWSVPLLTNSSIIGVSVSIACICFLVIFDPPRRVNSNETRLMMSSVGTCDLMRNLAYTSLFPFSFLLNTQLPPLIMIHLPSFVKLEGSFDLSVM